jgi:ABC-2 type transport system ATP-binding protein
MSSENAIEITDLTKRYGDILAVDNITFHVQKDEIFGFLGPNGAGKTTTIRLLTGLTRPALGTIKVAGFDMIRESNNAKERLGVVPEVSNIYDEMSAWDNLIFAAQLYRVSKDERENRAKELLKLFWTL